MAYPVHLGKWPLNGSGICSFIDTSLVHHSTLDPCYSVLHYNADSVIMHLGSWIPIFPGLTKAG